MNRIDIIGLNGPTGDHYEDGCPSCTNLAPGQVVTTDSKFRCIKCLRTVVSNEVKQDNGLTAKHYELPDGATELKHLIWYKNMNGQVAEAFRALYRLDDCAHSTRKRDLNKAKAYIDQELERMEKYDGQ